MYRNNLTGQQFGRLTASEYIPGNRNGRRGHWACLCSCGKKIIVQAGNLTSGHTKSCGCFNVESTVIRNAVHGYNRQGRRSGEYSSWWNARNRCLNTNVRSYQDYGGRGIRMCHEWINDFRSFIAYMGKRPHGHTLERLNVNGHYEPGNTVWLPSKLQPRNTRVNLRLSYNGETLCLAEWAERLSIKYNTLQSRLSRGWSIEKTLSEPLRES